MTFHVPEVVLATFFVYTLMDDLNAQIQQGSARPIRASSSNTALPLADWRFCVGSARGGIAHILSCIYSYPSNVHILSELQCMCLSHVVLRQDHHFLAMFPIQDIRTPCPARFNR